MAELDTPEFQAALARVLIDATQAAVLRDTPTEFGDAHHLTAEQVGALRAIDPQRFGEFAHDLLEKRVALLDKLMPNTLRLLDRRDERGRVLHRFHNQNPPVHSSVHPNRLIRDAYWLREMLTDPAIVGDLDLPHLVDVVTYEFQSARLVNDPDATQQAAILHANPIHPACFERPALEDLVIAAGSHVHVQNFDGDVVSVMRALLDGSPLPAPPMPPSTLMFHRLPARRRTGAIRINPLTTNLFDLLDGQRTVGQLLPLLAERHQRPVDDILWTGVSKTLQQFGANGLIRLVQDSTLTPEASA